MPLCDDTSAPGEACRRLPAGETLRQGTARDYLPLLWLLETSRWTHQARQQANLLDLLLHEPSALWLRAGAIRAALLSSLYRNPVASGNAIVLRDAADVQPFFGLLLPYAEEHLASQGARWLSFTNGPDWLLGGLATSGYQLQDTVLIYYKLGCECHAEGNREVAIRPVRATDLEALCALDAAAFEPFWRLNAGILRQAMAEARYFLVAESDAGIVGYLLAEQHGDEAHIGRIGVAPSVQRRGIGTRLIVEAFARMGADGMSSVYLNTQEDNETSRRLYEGLGFQLTGESDLVWAKELAGPPVPC